MAVAQKPIDACETLPKNNIYNNNICMLASSINKKIKSHLKSVERRSTSENLESFLDGKHAQITCGVQCSFLFLFDKYDKAYNATMLLNGCNYTLRINCLPVHNAFSL